MFSFLGTESHTPSVSEFSFIPNLGPTLISMTPHMLGNYAKCFYSHVEAICGEQCQFANQLRLAWESEEGEAGLSLWCLRH